MMSSGAQEALCVASTASVTKTVQAGAAVMISLKFTLCGLAAVCNCKSQKKNTHIVLVLSHSKAKETPVQTAEVKHFH